MFGRKVNGSVIVFNRYTEFPSFGIGQTPVVVRLRKPGVEPNSLVEVCNCAAVLPKPRLATPLLLSASE